MMIGLSRNGQIRVLIVLLILCFRPSSTLADEGYDACVTVYGDSTRRIDQSIRQQSELKYFFNEHCQKNGELKSSGGKIGFESIIPQIPFNFSASGASAKEKMQEFCKASKDFSYAQSIDVRYSDNVVVEALSNFNQCINLSSQRLFITHSIQYPESVIISGRWKDSVTDGVNLDTVTYDKTKVSCTSTNFSSGGIAEIISDQKGRPIPKNFNITCRRIPRSEAGALWFERATIGVGTTIGTYDIVLHEDKFFGFVLASEAETKYNSLLSEKIDVIGNLRTAYDRKDSYSVILYHGNGLGFFASLWAVNKKNFRSVTCPKNDAMFSPAIANACEPGYNPSYVKQIWDFSGGTCGNTFHELKCTRP